MQSNHIGFVCYQNHQEKLLLVQLTIPEIAVRIGCPNTSNFFKDVHKLIKIINISCTKIIKKYKKLLNSWMRSTKLIKS
jgi:hypothetical protein